MRELRLSGAGLQAGHALVDLQGVLTGMPAYGGHVAMLGDANARWKREG